MNETTQLPPIESLLRSEDGKIVIEVLTQLDAHRVRGIALTPTEGLSRGTAVEDTGGPLTAPVGKGILSRMFNGVRSIGLRRRWRNDPPNLSLHPGGCGSVRIDGTGAVAVAVSANDGHGMIEARGANREYRRWCYHIHSGCVCTGR